MKGGKNFKTTFVLNRFRLAASLAAEENQSLTGNASTSAVEVPSEEDDADEDEEMILVSLFIFTFDLFGVYCLFYVLKTTSLVPI